MSGFAVEPDVLVAQARRRDDDAARLDRVRSGIRTAQGDDLALGALCSPALGDVREAVEAVAELVRTLSRSSRVVAAALRDSAEDHLGTDEDVAATFGGAP